MAHLRTFQAGKHSQDSQRLLNEVAKARVCLLKAEKKATYDQELRKARKVRPKQSQLTQVPYGRARTLWVNTAFWKNWAKEASGPYSRPCTPNSIG